MPEGLAAQPYHAAAGLDLTAAGELIARVESAAENAAAAGLRALSVAGLAEGGLSVAGLAEAGQAGAVRAVAVVVKPVAVPDDLAGILRSHAWMHAAEGVLYRQAVLAAAQECGWTPRAVERSSLPAAESALAVLGRAAGRPWRQIEKDAARAALAILAGTHTPR